MRRGAERWEEGRGTNSGAGDKSDEVYACVRVLCASVGVCGCVIMNVQRTGKRAGRG